MNSSNQHVLGKPASMSSLNAPQSKCETFLSKKGIPSVSTSIRYDFISLWNVSDECLLWIARPVVY